MSNEFQTAVFAGGCFWCTEAIFRSIEGVKDVIPGYTGGFIKHPAYREVCKGTTGHAEGVKITFDVSKVSYETLLELFFATHNPTTLNKQGNDVGTQYRSEIFYTEDYQKDAAKKFISLLEKEEIFENPIVTKVTSFDIFYEAEDYHQNYYANNKEQPYCQVTISPKLKKINTYYKDKLKH